MEGARCSQPAQNFLTRNPIGKCHLICSLCFGVHKSQKRCDGKYLPFFSHGVDTRMSAHMNFAMRGSMISFCYLVQGSQSSRRRQSRVRRPAQKPHRETALDFFNGQHPAVSPCPLSPVMFNFFSLKVSETLKAGCNNVRER